MVQPNGGGEKHLITGYNIKMDAQSQANYDNKSSKPIILNYDFVMPIAGIIVGCNTFYRGELINKGSVNDKINHAIGDKCSIRAELKILEW
jgi:hypothetical protein